MLENRNMLCISNSSWEGDYAKTIVELMSVFAKKNKVLYVDNPYTIKDLLDGIQKKKKIPFKRVLGFEKRLKKIATDYNSEIYVLMLPVTLTINFLPKGTLYNTLLNFNGWLITRSIRKYLKQLDMNHELINITAFTPAIGMVTAGKFNEKLLIYHCYDAIEAATWLKKHGADHEKEFMQVADAVVVTSQGLLEKKSALAKACYLVKNAANINLFKSAFKQELTTKKVVGYIGSIDERLDYDLLSYAIGNTPAIQYVFIGRVVDKKGEQLLRKFPNVSFEGAKSLRDLPGYVKNFSLGIIPFAQNEFNKGIYPLKINEYLAAGLPVVSTNFSYLADFTDVIHISNTKEEFKNFIEQEIATDSLQKKQERLAVAVNNSWEQRVEQFSDIIKQVEENKEKANP